MIANNVQDGIDLYPGGLDVLIRNNIIRDNGIHGIEVKMYDKYHPDQTGQIYNVKIDSNKIINNGFNGVACLDPGEIYYAQGITITGNRIDSSGKYGIYSELPIRIENNLLSRNGLKPNVKFDSRPIGYPGIYLLNGRPDKPSYVINNEIVDQAPISEINLAYWMVVTQAKSNTTITNNKFVISPGFPYHFSKYGVGLINSSGYTNGKYVENENKFSELFSTKVVVNP